MYFTNNNIKNGITDWDAESTVKECFKLLISVDRALLGLHKGTAMLVIITIICLGYKLMYTPKVTQNGMEHQNKMFNAI